MDNDRLPLAVAGAGGWGKNLIRNFASLEEADLRIICDLDEDRLADFGAQYPGVRTTRDFDKVISDDGIRAVVIATPADTHYGLAKKALETGRLHVFVEKPLALSAKEAAELVELSEKSGLTLMTGHLLMYHPAVRMLRDLIEAGELGDIYCVYSSRLNLGAIRKVENAWWSLAPHDISILLYLLGESPVSVSARGECFVQPDVEDLVFATIDFPGKTIAQVHVSWLDPHKMRKTTIVGSKKMAVFDDMETVEKIRIFDKGVVYSDPVVGYEEFFRLRSGDVFMPHIEMKEPLMLECSHFITSVLEGKQPLTDGRNGLEVVKVLAAGHESMLKGGAPVRTDIL